MKSNKIVFYIALLVTFTTSSVASASTCVNLSTNLAYGNSGAEVTKLQQVLIEKGYLSGASTGFFGKLTQSAVKKFQADNQLPPTGYVGSMTRAKVVSLVCNPVAVKAGSTVASAPQVLGASTSTVSNATPTPTPTLVTPVLSLPYETTDFSNWKSVYGGVEFTSQGLELKAKEDTTVAIANFPKASQLSDYKFSTSAFVRRGTPILIARYKDDQNYIACYFLGNTIEIVQKIKGEQNTVASIDMPDSPSRYFFFNDINVSMSVKGKTVGCTMIGSEENITYKNIDDSLLSGGPAIQVWYDAQNVASMLVRKMTIKAI